MANSTITADKLFLRQSDGSVVEVQQKRTSSTFTVNLNNGGWVDVDHVATYVVEDDRLAGDAVVSLTPSSNINNVYEIAQALIIAEHAGGKLTFRALAKAPAMTVSYEVTVM